MPLGNLTSQFFANVYLNELDYYIKHELKVKFYIRYVDDFVIFHHSRKQLINWLQKIEGFLSDKLRIRLHPDKSSINPLKKGIDFVGFRNFYRYTLLRKRNIRAMHRKIKLYKEGAWAFDSVFESYKGWQAYAKWASTYKLREEVKLKIVDELLDKI